MRTPLTLALLALPFAALAQTPTPPVGAPAATPTVTAAPPAAQAAVGPPPSLLDGLIGKKQIVGLTKQDGTRYLCRFNSGDHGVYIVQEFHFAGPPRVPKQAAPTASATPAAPVPYYKTVWVGSGWRRRSYQVLAYRSASTTRKSRARAETDTTIPDEQAVRLLLAGVAGANHAPREIEEGRDMVSPSDIRTLQLLSPPAASRGVTPLPATPTTSAVFAAPVAVPATGGSVPTAAAPPSASAWTLTTLWPSSAAPPTNGPVRRPTRTRRRARPH